MKRRTPGPSRALGSLQDWGAGARDREEKLRKQNAEYLADLRNQMAAQKNARRKQRFGDPQARPHLPSRSQLSSRPVERLADCVSPTSM